MACAAKTTKDTLVSAVRTRLQMHCGRLFLVIHSRCKRLHSVLLLLLLLLLGTRYTYTHLSAGFVATDDVVVFSDDCLLIEGLTRTWAVVTRATYGS